MQKYGKSVCTMEKADLEPKELNPRSPVFAVKSNNHNQCIVCLDSCKIWVVENMRTILWFTLCKIDENKAQSTARTLFSSYSASD